MFRKGEKVRGSFNKQTSVVRQIALTGNWIVYLSYNCAYGDIKAH